MTWITLPTFWVLGFFVCHVFSVVYCAADAPETISMISLVMAAWRMRL